jgi:hypothetical protein
MMEHASDAVTPQIHVATKISIPANCCDASTFRPETATQLPAREGTNFLPVPEIAQASVLEFGAFAELTSACSSSAIGRFSSLVLRI